jgi:MarR family transcriptional regulator, organic hydroperoxide resistance regulator
MRNVRLSAADRDASTAELERLFPDIIRVMSGVREVVHRDLDLTYNQYKTLAALRAAGALSLDALRRELRVAASTASEMVERLVRLGLVRRSVPPENRRSLKIAVSPRGERYLANLEASLIANYRRLLGELPPGDRTRLVGAFRVMLEVLGDRAPRRPATTARAAAGT